MSEETQFRRLIREHINSLFDTYAQTLRLTYIEVLTLLQDLLGRYSSDGNATVFFNASDAESQIYETLRTLQSFKGSDDEEKFLRDSPLTQDAIKDISQWKKVTVSIETAATPEEWKNRLQFDDTGEVRKSQTIRVTEGLTPGDPRLRQLFKEFEESRKQKELDYQVPFFVNELAEVLVVYGQPYKISQFTFSDFEAALGLTKGRLDNSKEAYEDLMKEVRPRRENPREISQRKFVEDLKRAVMYAASQNVSVGLQMKQQAQQENHLSGKLRKNIDDFLTDVLDEYQLLRTPGMHRPLPPLAKKQKPSTKSRRPQIAKDHLL